MKSSPAASILVLFLLGGAATCAAWERIPPSPAPAAATDAKRMSLQDAVPNFRQPRDTLVTGGQPAPDAWSALAAHGITTVVNLRPAVEMAGRNEAEEVSVAGLVYREIPVDGAADITEAKGRELWSLLRQADGKVLVHCASGNRVGALLALGAAASGEMPPEEALQFGRRAGLTGAEPRVREVLGLPAKD